MRFWAFLANGRRKPLANDAAMPTVQEAYAAVTNAHTGLHQAIHELRHGSVNEAKQLLARQIAVLANVLMVL